MATKIAQPVYVCVWNNLRMGKTIVIKSDTGRSYDIFIYCIWVSTQWQWLVDFFKNRKEMAQKEKLYKNSTKHKTKNIVHEILKNISPVIRK